MRLFKVQLGKLTQNPHKQFICQGRNDQTKVDWLAKCIERDDFWPGVCIRFVDINGDVYEPPQGSIVIPQGVTPQIVFGHHRVAAAIQVKGSTFETYVGVMTCDDTEMLRLLCVENHYRDCTDQERLDTIVRVKYWFSELNPFPACFFRVPKR